MANLMLTTACNFECDYCFGREMIGPDQPRHDMTWDLFLRLLNWIDRANMPKLDIHLMGGEPTLHPLLGDMIEELAARGRKTAIFSNASVPLSTSILETSLRRDVHWIVNVNTPSTYRGSQLETLHRHLAILGPTADLTFNITGPPARYDYVLDYIERFSTGHIIKVGVALPTLLHENRYAKREDFAAIAGQIMELAADAGQRGVRLVFECGLPYCLFNAQQHETWDGLCTSHCDSRLDITPNGDVINCLPLCRIRFGSDRFADYGQAKEWFRRAMKPYFCLGSTSACTGCRHRIEGRCRACLADALWGLDRIVLPPLPGEEENRVVHIERQRIRSESELADGSPGGSNDPRGGN